MKFKIYKESDKDTIKNYIDKLPDNKGYNVEITQKKKKRSLSQNALYHLWLSFLSKETGEDVEGIAEEFKRRFLGYRVVSVFGEEIQILKSTKTLSTDDFTTYLDQIQMFCDIELGIILPDPNDKYIDQFIEDYE